MTLQDMVEKVKIKFTKPFEERVFVGGNYDFMPVLREICKHVRHAGFEPVLAFDFDVAKDIIYKFDIALLQECKYAIFEVTSGNGHMMELQEAIHSKKNLFCLYSVRGRKYARPPPAASSMLTSSGVVLLGYYSFENLKDIIMTIFPAVEDDLPSMLLRVLQIARVPHGTKSRIVSTLEKQQFSMNGVPAMIAPTIESIAWSLSEILRRKYPEAVSAKTNRSLLEILTRQRNAHYAEDNSDAVLESDLRAILSIIKSLQEIPKSSKVSDLLCIMSIALSRLIPPNQAVELLKRYGPQTHPLLTFEYRLCLGNCYYRLDAFNNALSEVSKALSVKQLGVEEIARAKLLQASVYLAMLRKEKYDYSSAALKWILEKSKDPETIAQTRFLHGCILKEKNSHEAASRVFEALLHETVPLRGPFELAIRFNRGVSSIILGKAQQALDDFERCLQISKNDNYSRASALGNIGLIYKDKGESDKALKHLEDALKVLDTANLTYGRDIILRAINSIKNTK